MANAIKWMDQWTDRGTVIGSGLDALAAGSRTAAGTEVDNSTNLDTHGKLELTVDFVSAPAANGYVQIHMVTAPDDTNYEDGSNTVDPGLHTVVDTIPVRADTAAQRLMSKVFDLEPAKTKFILYNGTSQAFPASGSVLKLYSGDLEIQ